MVGDMLLQMFPEFVGHLQISTSCTEIDIRFVAAMKIRAAGDAQRIFAGQLADTGFISPAVGGIDSFDTIEVMLCL